MQDSLLAPLLLAWCGDEGSDTALLAVGRPRHTSVLNLRGLRTAAHPASSSGELVISSPIASPETWEQLIGSSGAGSDGEKLPACPVAGPAREGLIACPVAGPARERLPACCCPDTGSTAEQELGLEMETMGRDGTPSTGGGPPCRRSGRGGRGHNMRLHLIS